MATVTLVENPIFDNEDYQTWRKHIEENYQENRIGANNYHIRDILDTAPYVSNMAIERGEDDLEVVTDYERYLQLKYLDQLLPKRGVPSENEEAFAEVFNDLYNKSDGEITIDDWNEINDPELYERMKNTLRDYDTEATPYERRKFDPRPGYQRRQEEKHPLRRYSGPAGEKMEPAVQQPSAKPVSEWWHEGIEDEREAVARAGGNPNKYYDSERPFLERFDFFGEGEEGAAITPDSSWRVQRWVSPISLSPREFLNIARKSDPDVRAKYIDVYNPEAGLLVNSEKTGGEWVPLDPIGITDPWLETSSGKSLVDAGINFVGQEFLPLMLEGFGTIKFTKWLTNRATKRVDEWAKMGAAGAREAGTRKKLYKRVGVQAGKLSGYAAIAGIGGGLGKAAQLLYGKLSGIQPDLTFDRLMDDTQLVMAMGALGTLGGEILMRTAQRMWRMSSGKDIPQEFLDRVRVRAKQWRDHFDSVDTPLEDMNEATMRETLREFGEEVGKEYRSERTFANMSNDEVLQAIEADLMVLLPAASPERAGVEKILADEAGMLREYYEALSRSSGDEGRLALPSYREVKEHLNEIRKAGLEAEIDAVERATTEATEAADIARVTGAGTGQASREEAAAAIGRQQRTSEVFPDYTNEAFIQRDADVRDARKLVADVLEREDYQSLSTKQIAKYIGEPLKKLLYGDDSKAIIRTFDAYNTGKDLWNAIPMGPEGQSVIQQLLEVRPQDAIGFIKKMDFTLPQLIETRANFAAMFRGHPDRSVRDLADDVTEGFDKAIQDLLDEGYKRTAGKTKLPSNVSQRREVFGQDLVDALEQHQLVQRAVDGKFLYRLVTREPEEMADFIVGSSPRKIRELLDFLANTEGGVEKTVAVQNLVLDNIARAVRDPDKLKENRQFRAYLKKHGDQLDSIFPDRQLEKFKTFEKFQEQSAKEIRLNERRIIKLKEALGEEADLPAFITGFFEAGAGQKAGFAESKLKTQLDALSNLADEFPELRKGMSSIFREWMRDRLQGEDYIALGPERAMRSIGEDRGFNLNLLRQFTLTPYAAGREGTEKFGRDLALILGKKEGRKYAKNLRTLATRIKRLNDREWAKTTEDFARHENRSLLDYIDTIIALPQKWMTGQISIGSRRLSLFRGNLGARTRAHLLQIVTDVDKIDELVKSLNRQANFRDLAKIIGTIAGIRYVDVGSEIKQDASEALRSELLEKVSSGSTWTQEALTSDED